MIKEKSKCTVRVPYVTCNLKPASISTDCDFLSDFTSCGSDLMSVMLKGKTWFYYQRFFEDYYIPLTPFSDDKLQLLSSGSHRSEFQDIVLVCLPFISGNIFFAYGRRSNVFHYRFKSAKWAGDFVVCSLEVILKIISLRHPFGLPV